MRKFVLIAIAFITGFGISYFGNMKEREELADYRKHKEEVALWLAWFDKHYPQFPSATKRGHSEMSADHYWPRPE